MENQTKHLLSCFLSLSFKYFVIIVFSFFFSHLIVSPFTVCPSVFCSASFKDTLLNDIRKAREKYQGEELAKELSRIKLRMDNTEVLTQDIVMNLLFSYRDIQVQTHSMVLI